MYIYFNWENTAGSLFPEVDTGVEVCVWVVDITVLRESKEEVEEKGEVVEKEEADIDADSNEEDVIDCACVLDVVIELLVWELLIIVLSIDELIIRFFDGINKGVNISELGSWLETDAESN